MIIEVKIPSPGESITEVELTTWFINDGDYVEKNQELAEIESDKATLTLTADKAGVTKVIATEGQTIKVGALACTIDTSAIRKENTSAPKVETIDPEPEIKNNTQEPTEESPVKFTPVAKKMLADQGISTADFLNDMKRITSKDVEYVLSQKQNIATPTPHNTAERIGERNKMSSLRKKISSRLVQVKNQTAMLTTFNEINMQRLIELRKQYKTDFEQKYNTKLGFMSFFTKAASIALMQHPHLNAMIDGDEIVSFNYTDISLAVQTPKGLMVPVIRNTDKLTLPETEVEIARIAAKAREGKLSIDEMTGGTFSITNGGVFGSLLSTPILNPPQSAILGMHNIADRPIAENGQVVIRPMMYVALSYDHRLVDGKDSVTLLLKIKELIENPEKMLFNGNSPAEKLILG